jgi:hypothetical protein
MVEIGFRPILMITIIIINVKRDCSGFEYSVFEYSVFEYSGF